MADEPDNATTDPTAPAATPQAPAAPAPQTVTLTVEEFEAKLNERAAQVRRAEEAKRKQPDPPKPKKNDEPATAALSPDEVQSMMRRQSAFDRAIGKANLNDEQVSILEALFQVEKPQDVSEWVTRKSKAFGSTQNPNPTQTPATTPAPAAAAPTPAAPVLTHPAPATTNPAAPPQSIVDWNADQLRAYLRSKGASPANPYSKEYRSAARELRNRFLAETAELRVTVPK